MQQWSLASVGSSFNYLDNTLPSRETAYKRKN
jgi:hypothetical protein